MVPRNVHAKSSRALALALFYILLFSLLFSPSRSLLSSSPLIDFWFYFQLYQVYSLLLLLTIHLFNRSQQKQVHRKLSSCSSFRSFCGTHELGNTFSSLTPSLLISFV
eukprot:TRINITY_DN12143_c0_g1_i1.p1 TRINITY_DN12143_c0_g1~~TRINITY_DN12143_c0_g1_i1.p1  ORF type:complete len:108 (-),score=3.85 TRINITY_DN12143_c0_g1_i1:101-424(-)